MNAKKRCKLRRIERRKLEREQIAAERRLEQRIESIMTGCSARISRAAYGTLSLRDREPKADAICMPDVAIYSAGHRTKGDRITCTGRQKSRGRSIPLV